MLVCLLTASHFTHPQQNTRITAPVARICSHGAALDAAHLQGMSVGNGRSSGTIMEGLSSSSEPRASYRALVEIYMPSILLSSLSEGCHFPLAFHPADPLTFAKPIKSRPAPGLRHFISRMAEVFF